MTEHPAEKDAAPRVCDWCGMPAPEGLDLMSIWWSDYECCSMGCVAMAEAECVTSPGGSDA